MLFFALFKVYGHSMMPTISPGQRVAVSGIPYLFSKPKKGDIVLIKDLQNNAYFIKRIAYIHANTYTVLGDNPYDSKDSRQFGRIHYSAIVGKVLFYF